MFDPQNIDKLDYTSDKLIKQFEITPEIYKRFIQSIENKNDFSHKLDEILLDWKITENQNKIMQRLI